MIQVRMVESKRQPRPRDPNELAKLVVDIATGEREDRAITSKVSDPEAAALGRKGGLKGGRARAQKLSPEQRRAIARKAAASRWSK
jgi:hypothetical protein